VIATPVGALRRVLKRADPDPPVDLAEGSEQHGHPRYLTLIGALAFLGSALALTPALVAVLSGSLRSVAPSDQLRTGRALPEFQIGERVVATQQSKPHWSMVHGFAEPENDGTWIISIDARLEFDVAEGVRAVRLQLYPYLRRDVSEKVVLIRGRDGAQLVALQDGITEVDVSTSSDSVNSVTIECDYTTNPFASGEGPDKRTLCVKLLSVEALSAP